MKLNELDLLLAKIEVLRAKLNRLATDRGQYSDEEVTILSRKLDGLILEYMRRSIVDGRYEF